MFPIINVIINSDITNGVTSKGLAVLSSQKCMMKLLDNILFLLIDLSIAVSWAFKVRINESF